MHSLLVESNLNVLDGTLTDKNLNAAFGCEYFSIMMSFKTNITDPLTLEL